MGRSRSHEDLNASGDAWLAPNEAVSFEGEIIWCTVGGVTLKVSLHRPRRAGVGTCAVGVDESQILALLFGEALSAGLRASPDS
jgi:hypothetical protein